VKARLGTAPVDAAMGAPEGSMYSDWMGRKFEDFVAQHTGQRINPFEFTTKFMPHEDQVGLMEKFHQSLTPEQQAYRVKMEDPGAGYANQVNNYLPKAEGFANARDTLKNMGIAGLGAGAGAVSGNMLYDALNDDDPTNDSTLLRAASTLGGAGLGGAAAYYGGTNAGRQAVQRLLGGVKLAHESPTDLTQAQVDWFHQALKEILGQDGNQPGECNQKLALVTKQADGGPRYITLDELKAYGKNSNVMELLKKGHGSKKCRECGTVSQCRCPSSVHGSLPGTFMDPGECWKCRERVAAENTSPEHVVKTAKEEHKTWIGVDLDGTLAKYNGWKGETHIGEPIPLMVNRVKEWLAAGKDVRIMTARVANVDDDTVENAIKAWCKEHLGQELPVTNVKDHQMEELWDDRAHRVEKNTGVKLAAIKQAIGSGNGLYLPGITPGPPVLAAPKPPVPAAPKPLPSRSTPWSQLPIANVTPRPNPKPAPGLQSWLSALRTPKTPAWLANKQTTIQSQKDMTDTRPMLQMANPAHRGRWWGTQDLTNFLHDDTGRRNFATEMAQHSLPDRPVNEFLQHPIAEALFERRNIATPYQMGTSNVADFPEGITRQSITGGLVKLTGKPAAGIPAPAVANHEFEHARQLIVTPHYDAHQRDFDDSTNEIVARMKGNSPLEIPAGLGDLVFTGEMADNILRERTGRGIEPGGEGPSVTYPNGVQHSVRSMLDQAKQHGYWDGRTMTDLLQTPEGQQYFRRISNPGNQ